MPPNSTNVETDATLRVVQGAAPGVCAVVTPGSGDTGVAEVWAAGVPGCDEPDGKIESVAVKRQARVVEMIMIQTTRNRFIGWDSLIVSIFGEVYRRRVKRV